MKKITPVLRIFLLAGALLERPMPGWTQIKAPFSPADKTLANNLLQAIPALMNRIGYEPMGLRYIPSLNPNLYLHQCALGALLERVPNPIQFAADLRIFLKLSEQNSQGPKEERVPKVLEDLKVALSAQLETAHQRAQREVSPWIEKQLKVLERMLSKGRIKIGSLPVQGLAGFAIFDRRSSPPGLRQRIEKIVLNKTEGNILKQSAALRETPEPASASDPVRQEDEEGLLVEIESFSSRGPALRAPKKNGNSSAVSLSRNNFLRALIKMPIDLSEVIIPKPLPEILRTLSGVDSVEARVIAEILYRTVLPPELREYYRIVEDLQGTGSVEIRNVVNGGSIFIAPHAAGARSERSIEFHYWPPERNLAVNWVVIPRVLASYGIFVQHTDEEGYGFIAGRRPLAVSPSAKAWRAISN